MINYYIRRPKHTGEGIDFKNMSAGQIFRLFLPVIIAFIIGIGACVLVISSIK